MLKTENTSSGLFVNRNVHICDVTKKGNEKRVFPFPWDFFSQTERGKVQPPKFASSVLLPQCQTFFMDFGFFKTDDDFLHSAPTTFLIWFLPDKSLFLMLFAEH